MLYTVEKEKITLKCESSLKLTHEAEQGIPPYTLVACRDYYKKTTTGNVERNKHR